MDYEEKQNELDVIKWEKSQRLGFDTCGTFNYCSKCNKSLDHPCARAWEINEGLVKTTRIDKPVRLAESNQPKTHEEPKVSTTQNSATVSKAKATKSASTKTTKSTVKTKAPAKKTTTKSKCDKCPCKTKCTVKKTTKI